MFIIFQFWLAWHVSPITLGYCCTTLPTGHLLWAWNFVYTIKLFVSTYFCLNTNRTPVGVLLLYGFLLWLLPTHKWFQKDSTKETRYNRLALDLFQLSQKIATLESWISILHQRWENELLLDSLEKPTLCQPTNTSVTPCNCSSVKTKTQINSSISGMSAQLIHSSGNFQSVHYHSCYPVMKWWTTSLIQLLKLLRLLLL